MMRTRREPVSNYSSVFINGKTIRIPIDHKKAITELLYPEFYDVAINNWCGGGCNGRLVNGFPTTACYTSATTKGKNFDKVVDRINKYFGTMDINQRPYQVALGGAGEPTAHPQFEEVLKAFHDLQIVPNYTTNGMHLSDKVIEATKKYCGGVAITLHPHLEKYWHKGIQLLIDNKIKTNVHLVISHRQSIDMIGKLHSEYGIGIDYFVLLPWMNVGFAEKTPQKIDYDYLEKYLDDNKINNIAFGANFYEFLCRVKKWDISLYPPEILSKYIIMDENMYLYKSSFDTTTPVEDVHRTVYDRVKSK